MPHLTLAQINHLCIYLFWLVVAVWLGSLPFVKPVGQSTTRGSNVPHRIVFLSGLYLLFAPNNPIFIPPFLNLRLFTPTIPIALTGLLIVAAGAAFAIWARFILGSSWSARPAIRQNHELILRGPYRIVRHPIYTGILAMFLGTALQYGRLRSFLGVLLCAIAFRIKLAVEERLMLHQFGDQYLQYRAQVRRLVPFLY